MHAPRAFPLMRVVVTGGTGYLGPAVVKELLDAGHEVVVLEHSRPLDIPDHPRLRRVRGDVTTPETLEDAFRGVDAVAHLVAIIREKPHKGVTFERMHVEATRNVLEAAKRAGATRFLHMSANGVDMANTGYFRTKLEAERIVKESGLRWTIFRPAYIAGSREGGFDAQFADVVDKFPVLPSFDGGHFQIQPVSRENVAQAFARALETDTAVEQTYVLVGPERMEWNDYLKRMAGLRDRKRVLAPAPLWAVVPVAKALGERFPATPEQLKMMVAGNTGDPTHAVRDLGLRLEPWEDAVEGLRVEHG
jgi:uncharacterized protein YbjT (DUF2867 family)